MTAQNIRLTAIFQQASQYIALDETQRVFIGKPGKMQEAEVTSYRKMRDGGTTYISLKNAGEIFIPSALRNNGQPSYKGQPMQQLDATDEKIVKKLKIEGVVAWSAATPR